MDTTGAKFDNNKADIFHGFVDKSNGVLQIRGVCLYLCGKGTELSAALTVALCIGLPFL